ncbi:MAG: glycosyltransferase family 4 protein [Candidatus Doudnabacteria bacterium]|nr:glycosyltransferase family 4 protein [Candidatus Doudnabacteria bacterium]
MLNNLQKSGDNGILSGNRKRIIFSNYDDIKNPYYGGGGSVAVHEIAKRLSWDFSVNVITGSYPGAKNETVDGVEYRRVGFSRTGPKMSQLIFQALLPFYVISKKFDVWVESFTPPFSTAFLQLFTRKPVVGLTHLLAGKSMAKKYRLPFDKIENLGLKSYKYAIALTPQVEMAIRKVNPSIRISVIPNGLNKSLTRAEFPKQPEHILFLGRVDVEQKGLDLLLEAYRSAGDRLKDELLIAGSGNKADLDLIVGRIADLGLSRQVTLAGRASGKYKEDLYKRAKFFVLPSRYETFPLTILEAFAFGCPVIMFDIENLKWVPPECAVKIPPFDVQKFGRAMADLAEDSVRLRVMAGAAKKFVRQFEWDSLAELYAKFLNAL